MYTKKKKAPNTTTSLSTASFLEAPLSHTPAPSWVRSYELQVPGVGGLLPSAHKDWCGVGVSVLLAFLLGFVRQTRFV